MFFTTLSRRFLGLTIIFVVIVEVLFFVPAVTRFRENYLQNRLELAQLAALAASTTPGVDVPDKMRDELLETARVQTVVLSRKDVRELALYMEDPPSFVQSFNLVTATSLRLGIDAIRVFFRPGDRVIRVIGKTRQEVGIEVTMWEGPLRAAMIDYALGILVTSGAISLGLTVLLYAAVRWLIVRPVRRVVASMVAYRDNPEDPGHVIVPRSTALELRQAEDALRGLQVHLTASLRQKDRLAALGGAVAKISHDLRNLLTTAQLLADRIEMSADPAVRRTAPKLVNSLNRAIALCERTLAFGKAEEPPPTLTLVRLAALVDEVVENEQESLGPAATIRSEIGPDLCVRADADQLFRVFSNLLRNAGQAIEASGRAGTVTITATQAEAQSVISVADTGPGLPPKARENLFQPFRGGARQGGSGLGLAIAAELVRGHGGVLTLASTGPEGTVFRLTLPGAPRQG